MRIVNHAVNHGGQMFRHAHHQSSRWQFLGPQMHYASGANLHRRRPYPPQRVHHALDRTLVNSRSRVALPAFPFPRAFVRCRAVHQIIDLLVWTSCRDRDSAHHAIAGLPSVSGGASSSIIKLKMSRHALDPLDSFPRRPRALQLIARARLRALPLLSNLTSLFLFYFHPRRSFKRASSPATRSGPCRGTPDSRCAPRPPLRFPFRQARSARCAI